MNGSERPLRVLHVIQTLTGGGAEAFLCALLSRFDERAVQAGVMTVYPSEMPLSRDVRSRVSVISIDRRGRYDPLFFGRMVRAMRAFRPDIVHAHLHNGKYWGRLAALAARVPIIVFTEHDGCTRERILPEVAADLLINRLTHGICTFTEQHRLLIAKSERLPLDKVTVIENGITLPQAPTAALRAQARTKLHVRDDEVAVFVVARLIARKNQRLAIDALSTLEPEYRERVRLFVIGGGEDERLLRDLARASGARDRITITGERHDVVQLLYGADAFYMPSLWEGMPLAMIEALSIAVPVISTPWDGVSALLRGGELGTILPDWEPVTTADAVRRLLQSPREFQTVAQRSMHYVRSHYDITHVARLHESWYRELARAHGLASASYQSPVPS